ncbi:4'-phosphopantetheinyl transferase superfamily protein [Viridibacillus arvi]|uniref:4'-phosphopantetheinyl transferase superfamily protein n=1 Tax=Viridibacillus arvi TaxID=263475 RepID=UPI0034CE3310
MVHLYIIKDWMAKVDKDEDRKHWSIHLITSIFNGIDIEKDANGKPHIINADKYINWSHNDDYLVIVFTESGDIGVDVENAHIMYDETLYGWVLHEYEKYKIKKGTPFAEIWTRKESIVKCTGDGIHDNLCELNSYDYKYVISFRFGDTFISVCSHVYEPITIIPYK